MFTDVFDENGACVFDKDQDTADMEKTWELLKSKDKKLNLLYALELVNNSIEDTKLEECLIQEARRPISYLAKRLGLTRQQACLFSIYFGRYDDHRIDMGDIRRWLNCSSIQVLSYRDDVKVLEDRGLIVSNGSDKTWFIPDHIVESICANKKPKAKVLTKLSPDELMNAIGELCCRRANDDIKFDPFCDEVENLLSKNMHLTFCRMMNSYQLGRQSFALLIWSCDMAVNREDGIINSSDLRRLHEFRLRRKAQYDDLVSGQCDLFSLGLLERCNSGDFKDKDAWKLTNKARTELLSEFEINIQQSNPYEGLIDPATIAAKQLFYNDAEKAQLDRISKLLQEENFQDVKCRLQQSGFNTGFTILLSGPAGTGKTEFVLQVAKASGRHIMAVKISDILDSFVGESEKNMQKMFNRYFNLVDACEKTPILFLDEIDSICSRRFRNPSRSTDQCFNNLQALFLQNMNKFKGGCIMIGTTNLTENMSDDAIERRFLMKTRIELPSASTRKQIWHSMLPELPEELLKKVAEYEFSGGKIENVVRKTKINCALEGTNPDEPMVINFCNEERAGFGKSNVIGF